MRCLGLCAIPFLTAALLAQAPREDGRWAFVPVPDEFSPDALLDLRYLNESEAGESGFVALDPAGRFTLGDGRPLRFWAVNTGVGREKPWAARPLGRQTEPDLARHARFLAKRGVNLVRLHAHLNPDLKTNPAAAIGDIDARERDWIWRTVAAMKKEGIYTSISPYWANTMQYSDNWNLPGGKDLDAHGLLFFDAALQSAYHAWLKALFAETNPYTGIPLASDPAVAIIHLQNEDSLLFWTVNNLKGEQRTSLARGFAAWAQARYGSLDQALRAWGGNSVKGDDPANGILEFHNIWEMTQNRTGGMALRLADQLQFWAGTMYRFNRDTGAYLRDELGCRQLINAGNWKTADPVRLEDVERWSYTANDVIAVNRYFTGLHKGPYVGWAIVKGDEFTSPSVLLDPREFPLNLKQVKGYPMLVTEGAWVMPNAYAAEGPFLVAAFQSLSGIQGYFWFATSDDEWTPPQSANGYLASQQKWMFGNPDTLGTFPAAALMYRLGYLQTGEPVVDESRSLEDMWARRTPILAESASFDPNRDAGDIAPQSGVETGVDPLAFLAGPVRVSFGGNPADTRVADLTGLISPDRKIVRAITGQIVLNIDKGYCTLDAPKAQGVAGFFRNQRDFSLSDVSIRAENDYGTVLLVSMDDQPLSDSANILVQVGTQSRPTGWQEQPKQITSSDGRLFDGFELLDFGRAPWQVMRPRVTIAIRNPLITRAVALDMNGNRRGELPIQIGDLTQRFDFPEDAMYVVLQ